MSAPTYRPSSGDEAIVVDEVGIESGSYGKYRLRSSYQPIFAREGQFLRPVAVEGTIWPYLSGEPVLQPDFFAAPPSPDWRFLKRMGHILPLRNLRNIGADNLDLYLDCDPPADGDPETVIGEIQFMVEQIAGLGIDPTLVVCVVGKAAALDRVILVRLAAEMRRHGLRIAIGDFGAGHWTEEQTALLRPDIFRIDGDWFRKICRDATTVRLFEAVMSRLREREAKVLVNGIEDHAQFAIALRAGADFFQGLHLAAPALVGTVFAEAPLEVADKLGESPKILPLRAKHQPR